jgi:hypothetical protein
VRELDKILRELNSSRRQISDSRKSRKNFVQSRLIGEGAICRLQSPPYRRTLPLYCAIDDEEANSLNLSQITARVDQDDDSDNL